MPNQSPTPPPTESPPLESARRGDGRYLRCPACGAWSRELLLVDAGRLACARCLEAERRAGA